MGQLIDISVPLHPDLPVWPGSPKVKIKRRMDQEAGDPATVSELQIDIHTGTHIDAPLHFVKGGKTTYEIPLQQMNGLCRVGEISGQTSIEPEHLEALNLPNGTQRLLLKTDNSSRWQDPSHSFLEDFSAVSPEGAKWLVNKGIRLIGIDYHSIQRFTDPVDTHITLLESGVVILEGLNLGHVQPGPYKLWCFPISIKNVEGAPARAVLETI